LDLGHPAEDTGKVDRGWSGVSYVGSTTAVKVLPDGVTKEQIPALVDRAWASLTDEERRALKEDIGITNQELYVRDFKVAEFMSLKDKWNISKSKFNKPQKLFDHHEDVVKHTLVDLHYRMQLANVHPHLFREFLSLGSMCAPVTQQKVMRDMQSGGNGHVRLPSQAQMCGANDDDNPNQTYESILYLFKMLAYYATEFTTRRNL
jgi:hypothetical protein